MQALAIGQNEHIYEEVISSPQQIQAAELKKENEKLKREKELLERALHRTEVQLDQAKQRHRETLVGKQYTISQSM